MKTDKGIGPKHVIGCHLDRQPEVVVDFYRLSFLLLDQRSILLHPCPPFSLIFFHHHSRLLDLILDTGSFIRYFLFRFFQKVQGVDDVLRWYSVVGVTRSSRTAVGMV